MSEDMSRFVGEGFLRRMEGQVGKIAEAQRRLLERVLLEYIKQGARLQDLELVTFSPSRMEIRHWTGTGYSIVAEYGATEVEFVVKPIRWKEEE